MNRRRPAPVGWDEVVGVAEGLCDPEVAAGQPGAHVVVHTLVEGPSGGAAEPDTVVGHWAGADGRRWPVTTTLWGPSRDVVQVCHHRPDGTGTVVAAHRYVLWGNGDELAQDVYDGLRRQGVDTDQARVLAEAVALAPTVAVRDDAG